MDPTSEKPGSGSARFRAEDIGESRGNGAPGPADAIHAAAAAFNEACEFASQYVSAKVDAAKASIRNLVVYAALGIIALVAGGALAATAVVLLCRGLAELISSLCGGRAWIGDIAVGVLVLGVIVGGARASQWINRRERRKTVQKYENRSRQQQARFGHDAHDQSVRD